MNRTNRLSRRPRSLACDKDDIRDDIPPDPKSSSPSKSSPSISQIRCLLIDIDYLKLSSIMAGNPAGKGTALLLQALRQQMSIAASDDYTNQALQWIISNDVLMMKMKKTSVFSRVLMADGVDSREQMSRLINTICSFKKGRDYIAVHLRLFVSTIIGVLRGKRLPSTTIDQLVAALQKISIRPSGQKEMIQSGTLEYIINVLETRASTFSLEYSTALAINLSLNSSAQTFIMRTADSLASAAKTLLSRETHGPACLLFNTLLLVWLSWSRVRLRAREMRLTDVLKMRLNRRCPLCELHIPYLIAIIATEAEVVKVPQVPSEGETDEAGDCCEKEVDSTDPLRPTSNELSGARLLQRRVAKDGIIFDDLIGKIDEDEEENNTAEDQIPHVPGQVLRRFSPIRTSTIIGPRRGKSEPRLGTAASQNTFIIETERRRPIILHVGLTEGAVEYKKTQEAAQKAFEEEQKRIEKLREEEQRRIEKEREKAEKEERLRIARINMYHMVAATKSSTIKKEKEPFASSRETLSHNKSNVFPKGKTLARTPIRRDEKDGEQNIPANVKPPEAEKEITSDKEEVHEENKEEIVEEEEEYDYSTIFGARPKVSRTPDSNQRSPI